MSNKPPFSNEQMRAAWMETFGKQSPPASAAKVLAWAVDRAAEWVEEHPGNDGMGKWRTLVDALDEKVADREGKTSEPSGLPPRANKSEETIGEPTE